LPERTIEEKKKAERERMRKVQLAESFERRGSSRLTCPSCGRKYLHKLGPNFYFCMNCLHETS